MGHGFNGRFKLGNDKTNVFMPLNKETGAWENTRLKRTNFLHSVEYISPKEFIGKTLR